jgi:hypothetical protein
MDMGSLSVFPDEENTSLAVWIKRLITTIFAEKVLAGVFVSGQVVEIFIGKNELFVLLILAPKLTGSSLDIIEIGRVVDLEGLKVRALIDLLEWDILLFIIFFNDLPVCIFVFHLPFA